MKKAIDRMTKEWVKKADIPDWLWWVFVVFMIAWTGFLIVIPLSVFINDHWGKLNLWALAFVSLIGVSFLLALGFLWVDGRKQGRRDAIDLILQEEADEFDKEEASDDLD